MERTQRWWDIVMGQGEKQQSRTGGNFSLGEMAKVGSAGGSAGEGSGAREKAGGAQNSSVPLHGVRPLG